MKKTNKVIAVLAAMVMVLALVAGCGNNAGGNNAADEPKVESVVGKWTVVSGTLQSEEFDPKTLGFAVAMEFKDDGEFNLVLTSSMFPDAAEQNLSGTWTQDGDNVTITANDESLDGKLEDGKLTFADDNRSIMLERDTF